MSQIDVLNAKRALAYLLTEWGITDDAARKAHGFIDDLVDRGWMIAAHRETRSTPPKTGEACLTCGRHLAACICGEHKTRPDQRTDPTTGLAACRAALRGAMP